jgi:hypothetical protein
MFDCQIVQEQEAIEDFVQQGVGVMVGGRK